MTPEDILEEAMTGPDALEVPLLLDLIRQYGNERERRVLEKYGTHLRTCEHPGYEEKCTCGFAKACKSEE